MDFKEIYRFKILMYFLLLLQSNFKTIEKPHSSGNNFKENVKSFRGVSPAFQLLLYFL